MYKLLRLSSFVQLGAFKVHLIFYMYLLQCRILGWPKSSSGFFCNINQPIIFHYMVVPQFVGWFTDVHGRASWLFPAFGVYE